MVAPPMVTDPSVQDSSGSARGGGVSLSPAGAFAGVRGAAVASRSPRRASSLIAKDSGNNSFVPPFLIVACLVNMVRARQKEDPMPARTGAELLRGLKDGRQIWGGEDKVTD